MSGLVHDRLRFAAGGKLPREQRFGERVFQLRLHRAAQGTRAVIRIVPGLGESGDRLGRHREMHAERGSAQRHRLHHVPGDDAEVLAGEPVENDDLVDAVQKFRTERLFELGGHRLADLGIAPLRRAVQTGKAERRAAVRDGSRADVRCHHDHGIAEIDGPSLRISEPPVVHDLQQQVEHVLVRLFDLVEEHDAVGLAAHLFGELAALVKADVARRRADEL